MAFLLSACASPLSDVTISSLDLGAVEPQTVHHGTVRVANVGTSFTKLLRVERTSGSDRITITPTQVGFAARDEAAWNVAFAAGDEGEVEANFLAVFDSGTTAFTVRALVAPPCVVEPLDLGNARVGTAVTKTFTVSNPLPRTASLRLGGSGRPFRIEGAGLLRLAANETRDVSITFAPDAEGRFERAWTVAPRTDCTATSTTLLGYGVETPLSFTPGRLRFAASEMSRTVSLRNHTRVPVRLVAGSIDSPRFEFETPLPLEVPANGAVELVVRALPGNPEAHASTLRLTTDSALHGEVELPLLVNFTGPCLSVSDGHLDFGAVELDCQRRSTVTVDNQCPHAVRLSAAGPVALISGARVEAQSSERVSFAFAPTVEASVVERVVVEVDVLDGVERLELAASGTTLPRPRVEESTVIPDERSPVDVLIVLDDSPRMLPWQAQVSQNMKLFGRYLEANKFDARVALMTTSTSTGVRGRLRRTGAGAGWLEQPTPDAVEELARVRGEGTGRSSCLEPLWEAFSDPLRSDPAELGGFLRPGAALSILCVTNGHDEIERPPMEAIALLRARMPKLSTFNAVARFTDGIASCDGALDDGALRAFVELEDGVIEEFCTPNWAVSLGRYGRDYFFGLIANVRVEGRPAFNRGPLQVLLNGQDIPPVDPDPNLMSRIWTWNDILNAVSFEAVYAPEPGTRVTFRYTPDCPR